MNLLPTPFDFSDGLTDSQLDVFTSCIDTDDFGEFSRFRKIEYMSEIVDRVLNPRKEPLQKTENLLERYSYGIKKNKKRQKNARARKVLNIVSDDRVDDGDKKTKAMYGTINEDYLSSLNDNNVFATSETVVELESMRYSLSKYKELKAEFERVEGVDLDTLLVRSLEGVPQAVDTLRKLVEKYTFLGEVIEDILTAREWGHDVLPTLD